MSRTRSKRFGEFTGIHSEFTGIHLKNKITEKVLTFGGIFYIMSNAIVL